MEYISTFEVLGPNMIGPSSSHTAGVVSIALMARNMFNNHIDKVTYTLYGSFARTYKGHGTDRALLGGTLGFHTDDKRIRESFEYAKKEGLEYEFIIDSHSKMPHPNTVDILLENHNGNTMSVRGVSVGGGKIRIIQIDGIDVDFTGEYTTLIVQQEDRPGVVAHIVQCLSKHQINIAFMRLFREEKGARAYTIVESDEPIPNEVISDIKSGQYVHDTMLLTI